MTNVPKLNRFYTFNRLSLYKDYQENGIDNKASLTWSTRNTYPRITVYTDNKYRTVDNRMNYDFIITAPFDYTSFFTMLTKFEKCIDENIKGTTLKINCMNLKYENNKRTDELYLQAQLLIGIDDNGIVFIGLKEHGKKSIKFDLLPSKFVNFIIDDEGNTPNPNIESITYAKEYVKELRRCFEYTMVTDTVLLKEIPVTEQYSKTQPNKQEGTTSNGTNDMGNGIF